jgi:lysophospholipase L1-like esterase
MRILVLLFAMFVTGMNDTETVRVFLVGDSTMADKPLIDNPEHGWGQMIPAFFTRNVVFINRAKNGRSTRSFLLEGRWDSVMTAMRPGDYVFIQFGHNDSKKEDTSRFADPQGEYKKNLLRFVSDVRRKNGIPVLITPVNRRNFDPLGRFVDKHGEYPDVVRDVAVKENVPLVDLHARSKAFFSALGDERSKELFLLSVRPNSYAALPNGKNDNTHFTRKGARTVAKLVTEEIERINLPLRSALLHSDEIPPPLEGITVGLDQFYNNERKILKDSSAVRFHYTWDDSADSGFLELAKIFDRHGADVDTLNSAPTEAGLKKFSVFIIVDPDTPKETVQPNYLQPAEIDVIERWVKKGGFLVLLANDKGNSEFLHFNQFAERFGIRFNEDMHQDVKNNQYDSGRVTQFPAHPMFRTVKHAFIKQFSSITTVPPAQPVLMTRGVTAIAEARIGAGRVIAVGDPWLYNEYIDNRRLPAGYENEEAANGIVRWICSQAQKVR